MSETVFNVQKIERFLPIIGASIVAGFFLIPERVLGVRGRESILDDEIALNVPETVFNVQKIERFLPIIGDGIVAGFFLVM